MTSPHRPQQGEPASAMASDVSVKEPHKTQPDQEAGKVPLNTWGYTHAKPKCIHPYKGGLEFSKHCTLEGKSVSQCLIRYFPR